VKPLRASGSDIEEALKFARDTANTEILAIDRLHKRTLLGLVVIFGGFTIVGSLLGWVGFLNLKQSVIQTTTRVTEEQVQHQLVHC